jgi:DNA-binding transcriptional regulator YiaG
MSKINIFFEKITCFFVGNDIYCIYMDAKIAATHAAKKTITAEVFRAARVRSGLNQREFARLAGVTPQYLSAIERGRDAPSERVWARLEEMLAAHGATGSIRPPEEAALLGLYRQLSPGGRRALETTAAALVAAEKK